MGIVADGVGTLIYGNVNVRIVFDEVPFDRRPLYICVCIFVLVFVYLCLYICVSICIFVYIFVNLYLMKHLSVAVDLIRLNWNPIGVKRNNVLVPAIFYQ